MTHSPDFDFSVITVSFNSAATIGKTIESVQAATGDRRIQQVFVDGGSKDGTVDIIRRHHRPGDIIVSEPDRGISDAFNKGIALARGQYLHFLNSDDWADPDFWNRMAEASSALTAPLLHGDLLLESEGRVYGEAIGRDDYWRFIDHSMRGIFHPAVIAHRQVFDDVGPFSLEHRYAMDLQWLQRAYDKGHISRHVAGARIHFAAGSGASFTPDGVIRESTALARARGVSALTIARMAAGKRLRIRMHGLQARLRQLLRR